MPLRPVEFHILVTLAAEERHGYAIIQEASRLTGGELRLEPGTLYRALHRMLKDGWVAECGRRPVPRQSRPGDRGPRSEHDERRRYYRLTPLGRRIAAAEAERLSHLVTAARAGGLLTRA
jgi:DNA-binding PadR family transcriptional regulator